MLKHLLRITGIFLAFSTLSLTFTSTTALEQEYPLGTTAQFVLDTKDALKSKKEIAAELNKLATSHHIEIYKPTANPNNPQSGRDIIIFGEEKTGKVPWFNNSYTGKYIPAHLISSEPLNGTYALIDPPTNFRSTLENWAENLQIAAIWVNRPTIASIVLNNLGNTGAGIAVISALILLFVTALTWFTSRERSRNIRLMGGVSLLRIHIQDLKTSSSYLFFPALCTLLLGIGTLALYKKSWVAITPLMEPLRFLCILTTASILICFLTFSLLTSPQLISLGRREENWRYSHILGRVIRTTSIIIMAASLPLVFSNTTDAFYSAKQQKQWEKITDAYNLSFTGNTFNSSEERTLRTRADGLVNNADAKRILFSAAIDGYIETSPTQLGGYEHLVLTNKESLDALNTAPLKEIKKTEIPAATLSYISDMLNLWKRDKAPLPNFRLLVAAEPGKYAIPVLTRGIKTGTSETTTNPLLIVLENPTTALDPLYFLLPAISNGNLIYRGYEETISLIRSSGMEDYVTGIDNASTLILQYAQNLRQEAWLGVIGIILIFGALCASLIQGALAWTVKRRKYLFLSITSGYSPLRLALPIFRSETLIASIIAVVTGAIFINNQRGVSALAVASILGVFIAIYALVALVTYIYQIRASFRASVERSF